MLEVTIERPSGLNRLRETWLHLQEAWPCSFFQSWAWVGCAAAERFNNPVVISASRAGRPVALGLFNRSGIFRRRLWLGESGRAQWDAVFIEHNGLLMAPGEEDASRACLTAALRLGVVVMNGITAQQLGVVKSLGETIVFHQIRRAPFVDLQGSRAMETISANSRYQLRRSARRYEMIGKLQVKNASSPAEAHAFLDQLAALHQQTWTARGKPGAFANQHFVRFHHELIDRTNNMPDACVDMLRVTAGKQIVGYLQNFCFRGRVTAYQSGFNYADAAAHAKPGMTCHQLAIEHYASKGKTVYDFLAGNDRYKTSLATGFEPLHWVVLARRSSMTAIGAKLRHGLRRLSAMILCGCLAAPATHAGNIPKPQKPGQLVGVVIENTADVAMAPRIVNFGQVFLPGQVPTGRALQADAEGTPVPVQLDMQATYPDGSARIGMITISSPRLAAHQRLPLMLSLAADYEVARKPTSPLDITSLLSGYDLAIDVSLSSDIETTAYHVNGRARLAQALPTYQSSRLGLHSNAGGYWRRGALASEFRLDVPIKSSLHIVLDITSYADGSSFTDVQFRNDLAMGKSGGALTYDASISFGGKPVAKYRALHHFQYQSWHAQVWSNGAPSINVRRDIAALERTGMVPNYDLTTDVAATLLAEEAHDIAVPSWNSPLSANDVTQYMATTGGRGDIGPTTRGNAVWLMTQTPQAAAFALGQADAAGAIPWQFWNATAGTWLNTAAYPDIWVDGRGGPGSYTTGLTQQVDQTTGWATDTAHQPDLAYVAYLMTGQRHYLDLLNAQAAFSITAAWPAPEARNKGEANVIRGAQLRSAAWSLRQIDEAAWSNPPGSAEQLYFANVADNNWHWLAAHLAAWSAQEGETAGYILGSAYGVNGVIPPWQQDYFVGTAVQAAEQGNGDALAYLKWSENFIAGRFLSAAKGFQPHNGVSYLIGNVRAGALCQTWRDLQAATEAAGQDNGAGWSHSDGDYGAWALAALAGLMNATGSAQAAEAYHYLRSAGAPHTAMTDREAEIQLNIVPRN